VHCLSSSGRRDPRELTTDEAKAVLDELHDLQVFYINIGGGEPMIRRDFFELLEYSIGRGIGVKFSTNGAFIDADKARRLAAMDYLDIQISLDGTDAVTNDAVRGEGSYDTAIRAMNHLRDAGFGEFKISVVVTRHNVDQLDEFKALADSFGAQLRITRLRPSGRGADSWHDLHPTQAQQRQIYDWLVAKGDNVLTGDSFFHLNALGEQPLPGLNMCGAGRVVCLIDPIGDVYACPFVIHDEFKAGSVRDEGGFARCGSTAICSASCASRSRPGRARRAGASMRARAVAWRRSSSSASRSTDPTPSASTATAKRRCSPRPLPIGPAR
jgi:mycofactocin biosynthetic radical S-adenosylmethionine protein MftC